jgi:purine-nucleoside phosphorylase
MSDYDEAAEAAAAIRQRSPVPPRVLLVLGSGLGRFTETVEEAVTIAYGDIPHVPLSTAPGHAGRLVLGHLRGQAVAIMAGRHHLYEGYSPAQIVLLVRALRLLGAEIMLITNAAGGVNRDFSQGTLMLITDHINLTGRNPLLGVNDDRLGPRFPDMSHAYDPDLRRLALDCAARLRLPVAQGVYLGLQGPSYETPAEIRMARCIGADAVGMSTVMESIAANHCGLRVLGISVITNMAAGILPQKLTEQEVIETGERVQSEFAPLVAEIIGSLDG